MALKKVTVVTTVRVNTDFIAFIMAREGLGVIEKKTLLKKVKLTKK